MLPVRPSAFAADAPAEWSATAAPPGDATADDAFETRVRAITQDILAGRRSPTRVLLVDDHALVRSGLALLIRTESDMNVVGEAEDPRGLLERVQTLEPDIIILDISMPGGGGLKALKDLRDAGVDCRCLVLTMHDEYDYLRAAIAAGADAFVVKTAADIDLLAAIRTLRAGGTYVSASAARGDIDSVLRSGSLRSESTGEAAAALSRREREVLEFVAYGYTSQQIADRLGLSIKTVDGYRARLSEKLGLRSRAELVRYALETGILDRNRPPPGSSDPSTAAS